jgi:hypothetical protein
MGHLFTPLESIGCPAKPRIDRAERDGRQLTGCSPGVNAFRSSFRHCDRPPKLVRAAAGNRFGGLDPASGGR